MLTKILLGISGGIAAYKSAELTRRLIEQGADLQFISTEITSASPYAANVTADASTDTFTYTVTDGTATSAPATSAGVTSQ